jgi:hypothetical protein
MRRFNGAWEVRGGADARQILKIRIALPPRAAIFWS